MRIQISLESFQKSIELDSWQENTTLRQIVYTAGGPEIAADDPLYVDSQPVTGDTTMDTVVLLEGSTIGYAPTPVAEPIHGWSITVAGGLHAGRILPLPSGRALVAGRSPQADVVLETESASWEHFTATQTDNGVLIKDSGSTNGTFVNGAKLGEDGVEVDDEAVIYAGGVALLVRPQLTETLAPRAGSLPNLTPSRTAPFNRPPRAALMPESDTVKIPKRKNVNKPSRFNIATVIAPLIFAGAMVAIMREPRYGLFALLSPVAAFVMWIEQKWRFKRDKREEENRFEKEIDETKQKFEDIYNYERLRLQELAPDPASVARRIKLPSVEVWQRRFTAADFMTLHVGYGNYAWIPKNDLSTTQEPEKEVKDLLDSSQLRGVPMIADLTDAGVIGIVGDREGALALARSLVMQAVTHCGPADLTLGVFFDRGKEDEWSWTSWLPHTRQSGSSTGGRWISQDYEQSTAMLKNLQQSIDGLLSPGLMLVIDSETLTEGRDAPARKLLGFGRGINAREMARRDKPVHKVTGIVIAYSEEQLPASCTVVVTVDEDAAATFYEPEKRRTVNDVIIGGIDLDYVTKLARMLAEFDDPELIIPGAGLPGLVRLPELTGIGTPPTAQKIINTWQKSTGYSTEIGVGDQGVYTLDLVKDGPHGLVGGTTGSGKSEFLRSLVAGLAAHNDPTRLNFILIDFKGGAAFKACERLPHTIGTISNLDEQLANRALISLEAEMERRQRLFASVGEGVDNIIEYHATNPPEPMPRLLLVIDEFAMLAKDFPDVLTSLVSIGAVGRTLGVHMILATQRPAGVVNNDILANTNLRVALRVQSKDDSSNVIEVPDAASIERSQMGRAYIKLGQTDITPIQTALVTGYSGVVERDPIEMRSTNIFGIPSAPRALPKPKKTDANDLDNLIDAIVEANHEQRYAPPRKVWPEALGDNLPLNGFEKPLYGLDEPAPADGDTPIVGTVQGSTVFFGLADIPEDQVQVPAGWDTNVSNMFLVGTPGSGTSTGLASMALTLCLNTPPDQFDMLVLDLGPGSLAPLKNLPHVSAYVGPGEGAKERQTRFLRHLMVELERRRSNPTNARKLVILIDGYGTLRDEFMEYTGTDYLGAFHRVYSEGPALGMHFMMATSRLKGIPAVVSDVTQQRWLFHLSDSYDYTTYRIRGTDIPAAVPGRCVDSDTIRQIQVAIPQMSLDDAVQQVVQRWGTIDKPDVIGQLPSLVHRSQLGVEPVIGGENWIIPVGIAEHNLKPIAFELYEGESALIGGSPRSGKSTLLQAIADSVMKQRDRGETNAQVWVMCSRRSPLAHRDFDRKATTPQDINSLAAELEITEEPVLLLIDDAERIDDADQGIANLLKAESPFVRVIASGKPGELRTMYSHWTKAVRKSRTGALLQPHIDYDGDMFSMTLPRRAPVTLTTGRGYVVLGGSAVLAQTICPDDFEVRPKMVS